MMEGRTGVDIVDEVVVIVEDGIEIVEKSVKMLEYGVVIVEDGVVIDEVGIDKVEESVDTLGATDPEDDIVGETKALEVARKEDDDTVVDVMFESDTTREKDAKMLLSGLEATIFP